MPLEIRPGVSVPIPCRSCARKLIQFVVQEGSHRLSCRTCKGETLVTVAVESDQLVIRSSAVELHAPTPSQG